MEGREEGEGGRREGRDGGEGGGRGRKEGRREGKEGRWEEESHRKRHTHTHTLPTPYLAVVELLPLVSEHRPNDSPSILDHHLPRVNVLSAIQPQAMDIRLEHPHMLLVRLL